MREKAARATTGRGSGDTTTNRLRNINPTLAKVKWNGDHLTPQQYHEMEATIRSITIRNGYDTSSCDALLVAVAGVFSVNITHSFNGTELEYTVEGAQSEMFLSSDEGHMEWVENQDL